MCASLSQDQFKHEGFWEVVRTNYGLVSPPSLFLSPGLRTFSASVSGREILLTTRIRRMWLLWLLRNQGPDDTFYLQVSARRLVGTVQPGAPSMSCLSWASHLTSLSLSFHFCTMGVIITYLRIEVRALSKLQTTASAVHQNHCGTLNIYRCPIPTSRNVDLLGLFCCLGGMFKICHM